MAEAVGGVLVKRVKLVRCAGALIQTFRAYHRTSFGNLQEDHMEECENV